MTEVELPDGTVLELPAGATPEQIKRAVSGYRARAGAAPQASAQPAPPAPSDTSQVPVQPAAQAPTGPVDDDASGRASRRAGVADSTIRAVLGAKQLIPGVGLSENDQLALKGMKQDQAEEPNPTERLKGNVLGGALTAATPGVGTKVAGRSLVSSLMAAGRNALPAGAPAFLKSALGGSAAAGGVGLALNPGQGDTAAEQFSDKVEQSGKDAAFGGLFSLGGHALKKAATGMFKATEDAKQLFAQGINPTLQQGADTRWGRFVGGLASGSEKVATRQHRETIDAFVKKTIDPNLDTKDMRLDEIIGLLKRKFHGDGHTPGEFEKILGGKRYTMGPALRNHLWALATRSNEPSVKAIGSEAMGDMGLAMTGKNPIRFGYEGMKEMRDRLQGKISELKGDQSWQAKKATANLIAVKNHFDQFVRDPSLSLAERDALKQTMSQYKYFKRLDEAGQSASVHRNPRAYDLLASMAKNDKKTGAGKFSSADDPVQSDLLQPAVTTMGLTPSQDASRTAFANAKRIARPGTAALATGAAGVTGGLAAAVPVAGLYGLSLAGQNAKGARALFGETAKQKALLQYLRQNPQLREQVGAAGFSLTPEMEQ